jgi:hypothetical protein
MINRAFATQVAQAIATRDAPYETYKKFCPKFRVWFARRIAPAAAPI